jgi:hypothetical protein
MFYTVGLITLNEIEPFNLAYKNANHLSQDEYDKITANQYLADLKTLISQKSNQNPAYQTKLEAVVKQFEHLLESGEYSTNMQRCIKETQLVIEQPTKENVAQLRQMTLKNKGSSSVFLSSISIIISILGALIIASSDTLSARSLVGLSLLCTGRVLYQHPDELSKCLPELCTSITIPA